MVTIDLYPLVTSYFEVMNSCEYSSLTVALHPLTCTLLQVPYPCSKEIGSMNDVEVRQENYRLASLP